MKLKRKKTRKRARRAQYASSVELLKEASGRLFLLRGNYEARVKSESYIRAAAFLRAVDSSDFLKAVLSVSG